VLPVAYTCMFQLNLPYYSSKKELRSKLLYAVANCTAIDLDGNIDRMQAGFSED